jgi:hypothetical protein
MSLERQQLEGYKQEVKGKVQEQMQVNKEQQYGLRILEK